MNRNAVFDIIMKRGDEVFQTRGRKILAVVLAVVLLIVTVFAVSLVWYSHEQNKTILVTSYTVSNRQIPAAFDGKRIVHLTDLHSKDFGDQLTEKVKEQYPDIIVITGDWINCYDDDHEVALRQAAALVEIAPVYYVPGNHEVISLVYEELFAKLRKIGFTVLENEAVDWVIGEERVQLVGVLDPEFGMSVRRDFAPNVDEERYSIVLHHRPDYFEEMSQYGADLLLCGHTHGGQIRLPFVGAVYGLKYDVGRHDCEDSTMILSQGLGESAAMRILTPPEMVVVTLDSPYV